MRILLCFFGEEVFMEIILVGACGRMGREVAKNLFDDMHITASVDLRSHFRNISDYRGDADVIIDFSSHTATEEVLNYAVSRHLPCVIASTGQTSRERAALARAAARIPVFYSENMSVGIAVLLEAAKAALSIMKDAEAEIIEKHHLTKLDAPSGTALMLARELLREGGRIISARDGDEVRAPHDIGVSSVRIGNIKGYHEIIISNGKETLTFSHDVDDRSVFARGALTAARFVCKREKGLYGMYDLIHLR